MTVQIAASVLAVAAETVNAQPDEDKVTPGTLGFLVMFALAVATVLLVRSMVGHLRKIRYGTPPEGPAAGRDGAGGQSVEP